MSRHRRPEPEDEDVAVDVAVDVVDDAPTGPLDLPSVSVVVVPRQRRVPEAEARVPVVGVEQQWAGLSVPERAWREWSDAPGAFVRPHTGPIPSPVPRPVTPPPVPDAEWGPWPPEQPSTALPAVATGTWADPERPRTSPLVVGGIAVLLVLLVGLGVGLVQPGLLGLHAPPLFETTGEAGPGT